MMVLAGLLLSACAKDGSTGACAGYEDGKYFRLELNNYLQESIDIRVNGRFVGSVPSGTLKDGSSSAVTPGYKQLGEFPTCDHTVIDYEGKSLGSRKVCATAAFTATACQTSRADFCFISIVPIPGQSIPPGSDPPLVSSPLCDEDPGPCANSIIYNVSSC